LSDTVDIYTTCQGDTWDLIAYQVYGDERYMVDLLEANPTLGDITIFPAEIAVICPDIEQALPESLPPWIRNGSDAS